MTAVFALAVSPMVAQDSKPQPKQDPKPAAKLKLDTLDAKASYIIGHDIGGNMRARLEWGMKGATTILTDVDRTLGLQTEPPAVVKKEVAEAVRRWRWKRIEASSQEC